MEGVNGALFFGVCRGKMSEGIDFKDFMARAVICISIPFPQARCMRVALMRHRSLEVSLMREYMDEMHKANATAQDGQSWYDEQAYRALNQGIGRCIRHSRDYGAILLLEARFAKPNMCSRLSRWFRNCVRPMANEAALADELSGFFQRCEGEFGESAPSRSASLSALTQPTLTQPTSNQPSISQPTLTQPTSNQPSIRQPSIEQPSMTQPSMTQPSMTQPSPPSQDSPSPSRPSAHTRTTLPCVSPASAAATRTSPFFTTTISFPACPFCGAPFPGIFSPSPPYHFIDQVINTRNALLHHHEIPGSFSDLVLINRDLYTVSDLNHLCMNRQGLVEAFEEGVNASRVTDSCDHVKYVVMYCKTESKTVRKEGKGLNVLIPCAVMVVDGP